MAKLKAIDRKGIGEENGRIITRPIMVEDDSAKRTFRMAPDYKIITCLSDYFKFLKEIHAENEKRLKDDEVWGGSQFFYRGHESVNYMFEPSIMRNEKDIWRENLIFKEFHRRFYAQLDECKSAMEEETFMQHFGAGSRILDLMENPLVALWAACFSEDKEKSKKDFGEVSVWCVDNYSDDLKTYDSSTVSVLANVAKMYEEFLLGNLQAEYLREHPALIDDYVFIKDVLRGCAVVRPKPNNSRIINQQGSFIVVNLTKLVEKEDGETFKQKFRVSIEDFSDYILNVEDINRGKEYPYTHPNIINLRSGYHTLRGADFSNLTAWDLKFKKISPNESDFVDTYGLYKYLYNSTPSRANVYTPIYFIVPPENKKDILKELHYMNITKSYIYPEMQNVAEELKNNYCVD